MKTNLKLPLVLLAGIGLGLGAAQALQAQAVRPPPAYIIAELEKDASKTPDPAGMKKYAAEAPPTIGAFGGRYVVRGGPIITLEGEAPRGSIVVLGFDSVAKAKAWYDSPAYAALRPLRQAAVKSRLLLVEGVPPQ